MFLSAVCVYHGETLMWRTSHEAEGSEVPLLEVHLLAGRTDSTNAELVRELTSAVQRALVSAPERMQILPSEYPRGLWRVTGEPLQLAGCPAHE